MDKEKLQEALRELSSLVKSPGWDRLLSFAEEQTRVRMDSLVHQPLLKWDDALEQEYRKGEIAGMQLMLELPAILLGNLEAEMKGPTND